MINVICGPKGSGKTKKLIDGANASLDVCKGNVVFLTDSPTCSRDVSNQIRFVNLTEYGRWNESKLLGFVYGMIASNADVQKIYVDGLIRQLKTPAESLEEFFVGLEEIAENKKVDIILSVTADKLPKFLKKFS